MSDTIETQTMDCLRDMICGFRQEYEKDPEHIYLGKQVLIKLREELDIMVIFKHQSDGKNYFMGIEILLNDIDDFIGLL